MSDKNTGLLREALAWIENSAEKAPSLCADIRAALAAQEPMPAFMAELVNGDVAYCSAQAVEPEPVANVNITTYKGYTNHDFDYFGNLPNGCYSLYTHPAPAKPLSARDVELIDGMIDVQLDHAKRCDNIPNRVMAEKQKGWDIERVELLRRIKASHGIKETS